MQLVSVLMLAGILSIAGIVLFGAPFVPTKRRQIEVALDLLNLTEGSVLYELGAGDGRVALAAAQRGLRVEAYELNVILFLVIWVRSRRYRSRIRVHCSSYWRADLRHADGIFIFSGELYMNRFARMIKRQNIRAKVASFAFPIPGYPPQRQEEGIYFYDYALAQASKRR